MQKYMKRKKVSATRSVLTFWQLVSVLGFLSLDYALQVSNPHWKMQCRWMKYIRMLFYESFICAALFTFKAQPRLPKPTQATHYRIPSFSWQHSTRWETCIDSGTRFPSTLDHKKLYELRWADTVSPMENEVTKTKQMRNFRSDIA